MTACFETNGQYLVSGDGEKGENPPGGVDGQGQGHGEGVEGPSTDGEQAQSQVLVATDSGAMGGCEGRDSGSPAVVASTVTTAYTGKYRGGGIRHETTGHCSTGESNPGGSGIASEVCVENSEDVIGGGHISVSESHSSVNPSSISYCPSPALVSAANRPPQTSTPQATSSCFTPISTSPISTSSSTSPSLARGGATTESAPPADATKPSHQQSKAFPSPHTVECDFTGGPGVEQQRQKEAATESYRSSEERNKSIIGIVGNENTNNSCVTENRCVPVNSRGINLSSAGPASCRSETECDNLSLSLPPSLSTRAPLRVAALGTAVDNSTTAAAEGTPLGDSSARGRTSACGDIGTGKGAHSSKVRCPVSECKKEENATCNANDGKVNYQDNSGSITTSGTRAFGSIPVSVPSDTNVTSGTQSDNFVPELPTSHEITAGKSSKRTVSPSQQPQYSSQQQQQQQQQQHRQQHTQHSGKSTGQSPSSGVKDTVKHSTSGLVVTQCSNNDGQNLTGETEGKTARYVGDGYKPNINTTSSSTVHSSLPAGKPCLSSPSSPTTYTTPSATSPPVLTAPPSLRPLTCNSSGIIKQPTATTRTNWSQIVLEPRSIDPRSKAKELSTQKNRDCGTGNNTVPNTAPFLGCTANHNASKSSNTGANNKGVPLSPNAREKPATTEPGPTDLSQISPSQGTLTASIPSQGCDSDSFPAENSTSQREREKQRSERPHSLPCERFTSFGLNAVKHEGLNAKGPHRRSIDSSFCSKADPSEKPFGRDHISHRKSPRRSVDKPFGLSLTKPLDETQIFSPRRKPSKEKVRNLSYGSLESTAEENSEKHRFSGDKYQDTARKSNLGAGSDFSGGDSERYGDQASDDGGCDVTSALLASRDNNDVEHGIRINDAENDVDKDDEESEKIGLVSKKKISGQDPRGSFDKSSHGRSHFSRLVRFYRKDLLRNKVSSDHNNSGNNDKSSTCSSSSSKPGYSPKQSYSGASSPAISRTPAIHITTATATSNPGTNSVTVTLSNYSSYSPSTSPVTTSPATSKPRVSFISGLRRLSREKNAFLRVENPDIVNPHITNSEYQRQQASSPTSFTFPTPATATDSETGKTGRRIGTGDRKKLRVEFAVMEGEGEKLTRSRGRVGMGGYAGGGIPSVKDDVENDIAMLGGNSRFHQPRVSLLGKPLNYKAHRRDMRYRRLQARIYNFLERPKAWGSWMYHLAV